jgi:hypothetical protein
LHVKSVSVCLAVHGDRRDAEFTAGADHSERDLSAVGDEELAEWRGVVHSQNPGSVGSGAEYTHALAWFGSTP